MLVDTTTLSQDQVKSGRGFAQFTWVCAGKFNR